MLRPLLALPLLLAGCSGSEVPPATTAEGISTQESGVACAPASPLAAAPTPAPPVALPPGTVLTDVSLEAGQRLVTGRVEAGADEVLEHFRSDPAYVVSRDEDEGRGGRLQLFGTAGTVDLTVARLTCPRGFTGFTISTPVTEPSPGR